MFTKENRTTETKATPMQATRKPSEEGTPAKVTGVPSIISPDLTILGNLKCSGDVQIDGTVEGDIESRSVVVGEGAKVEGAIFADSVRISGAVNGQVKARSVALDHSAEVAGDIFHESLTMEAGAFLEGGVRRLDNARDKGDKVAALRPAKTSAASEPKFGEIQGVSG